MNTSLTHGPIARIFDLTDSGDLAGCEDLRARLPELRPLLHVAGHIHEARGAHVHVWGAESGEKSGDGDGLPTVQAGAVDAELELFELPGDPDLLSLFFSAALVDPYLQAPAVIGSLRPRKLNSAKYDSSLKTNTIIFFPFFLLFFSAPLRGAIQFFSLLPSLLRAPLRGAKVRCENSMISIESKTVTTGNKTGG